MKRKYIEIRKLYPLFFAVTALVLFVFSSQAQTFVEQAKLAAADGANQDALGYSIAISGDTAIVGAPRNSGGSGLQSRGAAYIYVRNGATWTLQQKITASDGTANDQFGYSVAINGNTAVVGRQNTTTGANRADGKVYVFTRTGTVWTETQTVVSSDLAQGDVFGSRLAFENDTLIVSAYLKNNGVTFFQGAVYVFTRTGAGSNFTQQAKLLATDGAQFDYFGWSLAISGDTAIIGAVGQSGFPNSRGKAYIFVRNGSAWSQQMLQASDGVMGDAFGYSVGIDENTAIIGAQLDGTDNVSAHGSAYIFTRNGTAWTQEQKITHSDIQTNDGFGTSVAVKGNMAFAGATGYESVQNITNHGAVFVFTRSGANWTQQQKLIQSDVGPNNLGGTLAIDETTLVSGAFANSNDKGAAYVFITDGSALNSNPGFDFDGDGKADLSVFRSSSQIWYINRSSNSQFYGAQFGLPTDKLTPADFDGDGLTDIAVWRETEGNFYILNSSNNSIRIENFGIAGDDTRIVGDWDGDGKADLAVYRAGANSTFYYRGSDNNPNGDITFLNWGTTGDKPVRGDFDDDGQLDLAVFRPSNGVWYINQSSDGAARFVNWGISTDTLVPADYDGDGKIDVAVYRSGIWYILQSSDSQPKYASFGLASDQPVPADYTGDGKADIAVYRTGVWYVLSSTNGNASISNFGLAGDQAIPGAFVQ